MHNLVDALLSDLSNTVLLTQAVLILLAIGLSWLLARQIERRRPPAFLALWHAKEWKRFLVPLFTLLFILVSRPILANWQSTHLINLAVPLMLSMFVIQLTFFLLRSLFNPGPGLRTLQHTVSWLIWGVVALHITGHLQDIVTTLDDIGFSLGQQRLSLYSVLLAIVSMSVTVLTALSVGRLLENRFIAGRDWDANIKMAIGKIVRLLLLLVAVLIALPLVGIDITVLSVFGGALGVGLGLGLQKVASNYVAGFTLLLDNAIRIGDMVQVGDYTGQVTQITTRYTVLRAMDGSETILPNETMVTSAVINRSLSNPLIRLLLPVQVAYGTDLTKARRIMLQAAAPHLMTNETHNPTVFLKSFGESGIDMELAVWFSPIEQGELALRSDLNWALWEAFQREGIEIPFPQMVVHMAKTDT